MAVEYKIIGGDGREYGPATLEEIRQWCEDGRIAPGTMVWRSDERCWLPAANRDELKWDLPLPAEPPPVLPQEPAPLQRAGFMVRLAAFVLDWLVLFCLVNLLTLPWGKELETLRDAAQTELDRAKRVAAADAKTPVNLDWTIVGRYLLIMGAIEIPLTFAYFVTFNALRGATPGKRFLGLRVVRLDGSPIGVGQAIGRQLADWVSKCTFGVGYLLIAFSPEKRALHDLMARTQVVFVR